VSLKPENIKLLGELESKIPPLGIRILRRKKKEEKKEDTTNPETYKKFLLTTQLVGKDLH